MKRSLTRTRDPRVGVVDVYLPRWVMEAEETTREDRYGVLLIVDASKGSNMCINVVGKGLVSYLWERHVSTRAGEQESYAMSHTLGRPYTTVLKLTDDGR